MKYFIYLILVLVIGCAPSKYMFYGKDKADIPHIESALKKSGMKITDIDTVTPGPGYIIFYK